MTIKESNKLSYGLYRLYWKDGGSSIAAVGGLHNGVHWFAPTNWTSSTVAGIACTKWRLVKRVELIIEQRT